MALKGKKKSKNLYSIGEKLYNDLNEKSKMFYKIFGTKIADSNDENAIVFYLNNRKKEPIQKNKERIL